MIFYVDIIGCARCQADHSHLLVKELVKSISISVGLEFRYYTTCPVTDEPILIDKAVSGR
jgi:hypothetical protein